MISAVESQVSRALTGHRSVLPDRQPDGCSVRLLVVLAPRQEQGDAVLVPGQVLAGQRRQFAGAQRGREPDEQQRAVAQPGQGVGDLLHGGAQRVEHQRGLFAQRPAVGAANAGKGGRYQRRGGRRRISGEQMQVAQRRVTQPQGVDGEPPARLGREKRRHGVGRRRQRSLPVRGAPLGKGRDGSAVGAAGILGPGGAAVIGGGGFGRGEGQRRRRQVDDGLEFEPVADRVRVRPRSGGAA